jgi:hypothetical protein
MCTTSAKCKTVMTAMLTVMKCVSLGFGLVTVRVRDAIEVVTYLQEYLRHRMQTLLSVSQTRV